MARKTPLPEIEQQICRRLRLFRIEVAGMTAVEFARRLDIDSNRLASYEHARVPLRYEFAKRICDQFGMSIVWLAESKEPQMADIPIAEELERKIPDRILFSTAFQQYLKPHIGGAKYHFLEKMAALGIKPVLGWPLGMPLNRRFEWALLKELRTAIKAIPEASQLEFYREVLRAIDRA